MKFLNHLLRHIPQKIFIIWDRIPVHRAKKVRDFIKENSSRMRVYFLPPYAPELNPDEGFWDYIKWHQLKNFCPTNIRELKSEIRRCVKRIRSRPRLIQSFLKETPLIF